MSTIDEIRQSIKSSHDWLEGTMSGVTAEVAHWQPGGTAHPIGAQYAHLIVSEDTMINGILQGQPLIIASDWAVKTGLENSMAATQPTLEWAQSVRVDLEALRAYAQEVYASTDAYLAGLTDGDLEREVDLTEQGMGKWSLLAFLLNFLLGHTHAIMGEISVLKGLQGLQGYPF